MSIPLSTGRASWFFLSNVTNAGISFFTMIMLARLLPPSSYGLLAVYVTYSTIMTPLVGLSLDGSVSVAYFKRSASEFRDHLISCIAVVGLIFTCLAASVAAVAAPLAASLQLSPGWLLAGLLTAAGQALVDIKLATWMVKGAAKRYAAFQIAQGVIAAGLTFLLTIEYEATWESRGLALATTTILFACSVLIMIATDREGVGKVRIKEMRDGLNFGIPLVPHVCGALLFSSADRFIVNATMGAAATGLYQLAGQIGSIALMATDAINKAFSPWLYRNLGIATEATKKRIVAITYFYFVMAIGLGAISFLPPLNIATLIAGETYSEAGKIVPIFIIGNCIGGMYFMVVNYIFYTGRTGYLAAATLLSGLIGMGACYFFVGQIGLAGAGVAFVISKAIHFASAWTISSYLYPMPWMSIYRIKGVEKC